MLQMDPTVMSDVQDAPWTVLRLAKAARKQGQYEVSTAMLDRLFRVQSFQLDDAFAKTREHILVSGWLG